MNASGEPLIGQHDLALDVDAGVLVQALGRERQAVADEDDGALDGGLGRGQGVDGEVAVVEGEGPAVDRQGGDADIDRDGPLDRDLLEVRGPAVAARLEAVLLEPGGHVVGRLLVAGREGLAAFELVGGQVLDVGF